METPPTVCNIKFHFRTKISAEFIHNLEKKQGVRHNNFTIVKEKNLIFTIFHNSRHINVTGVLNFAKIDESLNLFNSWFNAEIKWSDIIIDNTTSLGQLEN